MCNQFLDCTYSQIVRNIYIPTVRTYMLWCVAVLYIFLGCVCNVLFRSTGEATHSQWSDTLSGVQVCGGQLCVQEGRQDPQSSQQ